MRPRLFAQEPLFTEERIGATSIHRAAGTLQQRRLLWWASCWILLSGSTGCAFFAPEVSTMPVVHNPFPQLSRVAIAPFFNLSDEPTVDGRNFALAYFTELQSIPGFEVVPLGVVEEAILAHQINLSNPAMAADEARRLGQALGVQAVVVGAVTDYTPYYPPRCGMRVEWYASNAGFHEIPAGYGLPWGTPEEEYIPERAVFEAEMALAQAQMATQTPDCPLETPPAAMPPVNAVLIPPMTPQQDPLSNEHGSVVDDEVDSSNKEQEHATNTDSSSTDSSSEGDRSALVWQPAVRQTSYQVDSNAAVDISGATQKLAAPPGSIIPTSVTTGFSPQNFRQMVLPPDWPDPSGFTPPGPCAQQPECQPHDGPVMTHTRVFVGHDPEFTTALAAYVDFRDDARFGGWRSYLERSNDFIRFCCHLHISDMLSLRGGTSETRVVRHWPNSR